MNNQTQKETFPVEDKEHYRRVMLLLLRKWIHVDGFPSRTNTVLIPSWQEALLLKDLFISVLDLSELEAESLILAYGRVLNCDFRLVELAARSGLQKIKHSSSLEKLAQYVDEWMGLGSKEQAREKFLGLFSENTDYGYSGWSPER
jgi:hypothetical protein